jgi:hypothetical protein
MHPSTQPLRGFAQDLLRMTISLTASRSGKYLSKCCISGQTGPEGMPPLILDVSRQLFIRWFFGTNKNVCPTMFPSLFHMDTLLPGSFRATNQTLSSSRMGGVLHRRNTVRLPLHAVCIPPRSSLGGRSSVDRGGGAFAIALVAVSDRANVTRPFVQRTFRRLRSKNPETSALSTFTGCALGGRINTDFDKNIPAMPDVSDRGSMDRSLTGGVHHRLNSPNPAFPNSNRDFMNVTEASAVSDRASTDRPAVTVTCR